MFTFELKKQLSDNEFLEYFDFMKGYLIDIYGESAISKDSYEFWKKNNSSFNSKYFIKMFCKNSTCGYAELLITEKNSLYFSNIIIKEDFRLSRVLLEFICFVLDCKEFKSFNEISLHINKKNNKSYNAWKRFGYELIEEGQNSNKYKILRKNIENYVKNIKKC